MLLSKVLFENSGIKLTMRGIIVFLLSFIVVFLLWNISKPLLLGLGIFSLFLITIFEPEFGLYTLTATAFFIGWGIDFSQFEWLRGTPFLSTLNAPVVDFIALGVLSALFFTCVFRIKGYSFTYVFKKNLGFVYYLPFLTVSLAAVFFVVEPPLLGESFYYFTRNILFAYVAFVLVPVVAIKDRKILQRVLWILFWVATAVGLFGLVSIVKQLGAEGWPRVSPFSLFGFAPLKFNHNILAEVLIAVIPPSLYLAMSRKKGYLKKIMFTTVIFIILIAVLTLSRAAWISLILQAMVALFLFKKRVKNFFENKTGLKYILLLLGIPAVGYMLFFMTSHIVVSSTRWRSEVLRIVWFYFKESPLLGYGPGMFINILEQVKAYTIEFGKPLDAHGFVQKIALEQGAAGLLTFFGFLGAVFRYVWKRQREAQVGRILSASLLVAAIGAVTFQLFNTSYYNAHMWFPIGLALASANVFRKLSV